MAAGCQGGGGDMKGQLGSLGWDGHVHTAISKMDNNKDLLYSTGNCSGLCGSLDGRECGRECRHVSVWLSPFTVHLKLNIHLKHSTVNQLYPNTTYKRFKNG